MFNELYYKFDYPDLLNYLLIVLYSNTANLLQNFVLMYEIDSKLINIFLIRQQLLSSKKYHLKS